MFKIDGDCIVDEQGGVVYEIELCEFSLVQAQIITALLNNNEEPSWEETQPLLEAALQDWGAFPWSDWVPAKVIEQIVTGRAYRTPKEWLEAAQWNNMPLLGQRVRMQALSGQLVEGRFVFFINNIGRVVLDDGSYECVSNPRPGLLHEGPPPQNWEAV